LLLTVDGHVRWLDDLVLGREPEPPAEPEPVAVVAGGGVEPPPSGASGAAAAAPAAPSTGVATPAAGSSQASGSVARTGAPAAAAGPIRRRLRPAVSHRLVGPGGCSGCHTPQNEWWFRDAHYRSADPFFDGEVDNIRIATLYGLSPSDMTIGRNLCMDCHGTVISGKESREVLDGVSCESCHGAAADWLEPHKDETDKQLGRRRPGHLAALQRGKADLRDLSVRAATCVGCHLVTDPRLLSAGHPSGAGKDWVEAMGKVRHWESGPVPVGELRTAYGAAVASRGPVPRVQRAVLASAGVSPGAAAAATTTAAQRPGTTSLVRRRRDEPSAVLTLKPPPPRPVSRAARGGETAGLELPPFPEISESTPVDELLALLQRRLEMLYRLVGQEGGGE
ncbi:MAG: multiheme c-type cytochrome, partial [Thermoanaerobaculia bacterium]